MRNHHALGLFVFTSLLFFAFGLTAARSQSVPQLVPYDGGFFSINIPRGWNIITAGQCSTFAFVARDPNNSLRQIFFFGEIGPVYVSEQQRMIDQQYMAMGGYPVSWADTPAVEPLTAGNFFACFSQLANTQMARQFMPRCPRLERFQIISETAQPSAMPGARASLVRGLFTKNNEVGQGMFVATLAPMSPMNGGPGGGIAFAFLVAGVTAPKSEFASLQGVLTRSLQSYNISQSYVNNCLQMQAQAWAGVQKAGQTLRETSDMIMDGWQSRNKTYDIVAEKRSDAILGRERLYNPTTGEVYEFENGFYDRYNLHRQQYEMSNLQPLPDNSYELWMKAAKDGRQHLR